MPSLYAIIHRLADLLDVTLSGTGWLHWNGSSATVQTPTAADVGADPAGTTATHAALTTTAHGGLVASTDSRLTNARPPTAHASTHASGGSDPVTPAAIGALSPGQALGPGTVTGGSRYATNTSQAISTSATNGNGTLRVSRIELDKAVTVDRLAVDITVAGEAGSLVRLGIYADNAGVPGALVLDAGTVAGDGTPGIKEAVVSQALAAGVYWMGAAVQAAPTTQPTLRICAGLVPTTQSGTLSTLSQTWGGYSQTGVSGALPANFSAAPSLAVTVPRVALRIV